MLNKVSREIHFRDGTSMNKAQLDRTPTSGPLVHAITLVAVPAKGQVLHQQVQSGEITQ